MVLDVAEAADDAEEQPVIAHAELAAQDAAGVGRNGADLDAERHDAELLRASHAKLRRDLAPLLLAHYDDAIRREAREHFFDRPVDSTAHRPEIAAEGVAVKRMHDATAARTEQERSRSRPSIEEGGHPADRARLRFVRVDDVGFKAPQLAKDLDDRGQVACAELPAHLGDDDRVDPVLGGEVPHVTLAVGDDAGDQLRDDPPVAQPRFEPRDVLRRAPDVQTVDDAQDSQRANWSATASFRLVADPQRATRSRRAL